MLLLPLHPPVLEPDLYLALGQTHSVRDLHPPAPGQVPVEVEFLLQLQSLLAGVGSARPLRHSSIVTGSDWKGWEKAIHTQASRCYTQGDSVDSESIFRSSLDAM